MNLPTLNDLIKQNVPHSCAQPVLILINSRCHQVDNKNNHNSVIWKKLRKNDKHPLPMVEKQHQEQT